MNNNWQLVFKQMNRLASGRKYGWQAERAIVSHILKMLRRIYETKA